MKIRTFFVLTYMIAIAALGVAFIGCSNNRLHSTDDDPPSSVPQIVDTEPGDGAHNVSTGAAIGIKFNMPMDTTSVSHAFRLLDGQALDTWMAANGYHDGMMSGHMGGMDYMMRNRMMAWADSNCFAGSLHWNAARDSCYFIPRGGLLPHQEHALYMSNLARSARGIPMDVDGYEYGGPMIRFQTGQ
jgi:hypothetical protein